jgi:hypothetical protein
MSNSQNVYSIYETVTRGVLGVPDDPRTDRQPWSHGCRLTSRPPLDDIRRQAPVLGIEGVHRTELAAV